MIKGQKYKIVCLVDDAPFKINEIYEGEYYSYNDQQMLTSYSYAGYTVFFEGVKVNIKAKDCILLSEFRDKQIDEIFKD